MIWVCQVCLIVLMFSFVEAATLQETVDDLQAVYQSAFGPHPIEFKTESVFIIHDRMESSVRERAWAQWAQLYRRVIARNDLDELRSLLKGKYGTLPVLSIPDLIVLDRTDADQFGRLFWQILDENTAPLLQASLRSYNKPSYAGEILASRLARSFLNIQTGGFLTEKVLTYLKFVRFSDTDPFYVPYLASHFMAFIFRDWSHEPHVVQSGIHRTLISAFDQAPDVTTRAFLLEQIAHLGTSESLDRIKLVLETRQAHPRLRQASDYALVNSTSLAAWRFAYEQLVDLSRPPGPTPNEVEQYNLYGRKLMQRSLFWEQSRSEMRKLVFDLMASRRAISRRLAVTLLSKHLFTTPELDRLLGQAATDPNASVRHRLAQAASVFDFKQSPWFKHILINLQESDSEEIARDARHALEYLRSVRSCDTTF